MNNNLSPDRGGIITSNYELSHYMLDLVYRPIVTLYTVLMISLTAIGGIGLILNLITLTLGETPDFLSFPIFSVCIIVGILSRVVNGKRIKNIISSYFLINGYRFHTEIREDGILVCTQYSTDFFRYGIVRSVRQVGDMYVVCVGEEKAPNMIFIGSKGFADPVSEGEFRARLTAVVGEKKFVVKK